MKDARPLPSIRRQLTIQILVGTLVMLFIAGAIFLGVIHRRLVANFDAMLGAEAATLARNAERKGRLIVWDVPDDYSVGSRENAEPAYCQMFLADGTVVGLSQTLGVDNLPRLAGRADVVWDATLPNGRHGRMLQKTFHPTADNAESQAAPDDPHEQTFTIPATLDPAGVDLVLVVARSRERLDGLITSLYVSGAAVAVGLAGALAGLVRVAIGRGLRPIAEINAQIAAIAPDALSARLQVASPPVELAAVETAVNRLLERVERAFEKERRFSSDLAHELRTPIAELRTACEVGARWPDDPESTRQFFSDTRATALHLEKIVTTLLTLSRCEEGKAPVHARRIEVQTLVRSCWQHAAADVAEKRLRFEERIAPGLTIESDEDKLEMVIRNLLENAVAHGEPGTVVECLAAATPNGVELRIINTALDLEPADLEHLFDRFWRKEAARSDRQHVGLGLAITRALCEVLGIRVQVDLRDGNRFEARLLFPDPAR